MRTKQELEERLSQYKMANFIYSEDIGYIAWQISTGENIEILFIETKEHGIGYGKSIMKMFLEAVRPYHSVFVFRLAENEQAGFFYRKCGFKETLVRELYKGGDAVLGVATYENLCKNLLIN